MALYFYTIATIQYPRILYKNFEFLVHNIYKNGRFINNFDKLYKDITKLHIDKECIYLFHAIRANPKIIEQQYVDMKLDTAPVKYLPDDLKIICENGLNPDVVDAGFFPDSHNRPYVDLGKQYLAGTYSGANFYSDRFTTDSSGLILVIKIPIVIAWNYEFVFNSMDHIYTSIKITQEYIYVSSQDECFMQKKEYEKIRAVSYNGFNDYISHTELTIIPLNEYYTKYYNKGPYTGNCKSHNEINGGFNDYPIMIKVGKKWRPVEKSDPITGTFAVFDRVGGKLLQRFDDRTKAVPYSLGKVFNEGDKITKQTDKDPYGAFMNALFLKK